VLAVRLNATCEFVFLQHVQIIKSQRAGFDDERRRVEAELFGDDVSVNQKAPKRKKHRSKHKKPPVAPQVSINGDEASGSGGGPAECCDRIETKTAAAENGVDDSANCDAPCDRADSSGDNIAESKYNNGKVRKKKYRRKAGVKRKVSQESTQDEEDEAQQVV